MLYKDQNKSDKIALKVKPGIKKLANNIWGASYPFLDKMDVDALFEQIITSEALRLNLVPVEDLPEHIQVALRKEEAKKPNLDMSVYDDLESLNDLEDDRLEDIPQTKAVQLLR